MSFATLHADNAMSSSASTIRAHPSKYKNAWFLTATISATIWLLFANPWSYHKVGVRTNTCGELVITPQTVAYDTVLAFAVALQTFLMISMLLQPHLSLSKPWISVIVWLISAAFRLVQSTRILNSSFASNAWPSPLPVSVPSAMSRGASSPVLIAPCSLSRATLFRMEYEILWFGLGIGATILHLRGLSRQWILRHRVQSMHASLERARQIKQAIKSLAQQGDDIPDTLQDVLVRARQEARGMIDQADGDVSPELQKSADDIYSELTEAMSFVLMVNESKAKQSIERETTLG